MALKIDHIGIAVKNLDEAMNVYLKIFGIKPTEIHRSPEMDMGVALYILDNIKIEVMESTKPGTPIAKFLDSRGEGIHHICYAVDNIDKKLESLNAGGIRLIDNKARPGLEGMIAFIHPKETLGVLTELLQIEPKDTLK